MQTRELLRPVDELVTPAEMAQRLRIKRRTLDEWSLSGLIPRVKMNNKLVRYDPAAVVRALEAAQSAGVKE